MYIRFIIETADPGSDFVWSLFGAMGHLQESGELTEYEQERLDTIDHWFAKNLNEPDRLSRSRRTNAELSAIGWFRPEAHQCIGYVRELVAILKAHDIAVQMVTSDRPGYIVYEDEHQVAAVPFRES
jgi:hypothetical protein